MGRSGGYIIAGVIMAIIIIGAGAVFLSEREDYTIEVAEDIGGHVTGSGTYRERSTVELVAHPDEEYYFAGWYKDGELYATSSSISFKASENLSLVAKFEWKILKVDVDTNYRQACLIQSPSQGLISYGESFTCSVSQRALGYVFEGWYVEDNSGRSRMVSFLEDYTFIVREDTFIFAKYSILHDASFTITVDSYGPVFTYMVKSVYDVEVTQRSWNVIDFYTGKQLLNITGQGNNDSQVFSMESGYELKATQNVTYSDGQTATCTITKQINEITKKCFTWNYNAKSIPPAIDMGDIRVSNRTFDLYVPVSYDWYLKALYAPIPRSYSTGDCDDFTGYVTYNHPMIISMAQTLSKLTKEMNDIDQINLVLNFVRSIPYQYDIEGKGVRDYWRLPVETLCEGKGDCEDHAFLFASLMKAMGYRVAILDINVWDDINKRITNGHMAAAVAVEGGSGSSMTIGGVDYYYCETTGEMSTGKIGDAFPSNYYIVCATPV